MSKYVKVFLCSCEGEGVAIKKNDDSDIEMSFWSLGFSSNKWTWKQILKACWYLIRHRTFWTDMVILRPVVAKNLAYHILYIVSKDREKEDSIQKPLVKGEF